MRRLAILFALVLFEMTASAQARITETGIYEYKEVFTAEGVPAHTLYVRALEALSDWAGSQQRSKANVDVQDKDEGLVVYKGQIYLGFKKANLLCGWDGFADFTMKTKCKDGRIQITITVPSLSFYWSCGAENETAPFNEIYPEYKHKGKMAIKKAAQELVEQTFVEPYNAVKYIGSKITQPSDDDF